MSKFKVGDKIVVSTTLNRPSLRTGTVIREGGSSYVILWDSDRATVHYNSYMIDNACSIYNEANKNDPNFLFKQKRR